MAMRSQPEGVRRTRRGTDTPPREYDVFVDEELAGHVERLPGTKAGSAWRVYRDGEWPRKFERGGGYLAAVRVAGWRAPCREGHV